MKIPVQNQKQTKPSLEEQIVLLKEELAQLSKDFEDFRIATESCLKLHREQIAIIQEKKASDMRNDFLLRKKAINVFKSE